MFNELLQVHEVTFVRSRNTVEDLHFCIAQLGDTLPCWFSICIDTDRLSCLSIADSYPTWSFHMMMIMIVFMMMSVCIIRRILLETKITWWSGWRHILHGTTWRRHPWEQVISQTSKEDYEQQLKVAPTCARTSCILFLALLLRSLTSLATLTFFFVLLWWWIVITSLHVIEFIY
jgi:hypothetical protein